MIGYVAFEGTARIYELTELALMRDGLMIKFTVPEEDGWPQGERPFSLLTADHELIAVRKFHDLGMKTPGLGVWTVTYTISIPPTHHDMVEAHRPPRRRKRSHR